MDRRKFLKGYRTRAYGHACVPCFEMLEVSLSGARFLTFMQVVTEDLKKYSKILADDITRESVWLKIIRSRKADGSLREASE